MKTTLLVTVVVDVGHSGPEQLKLALRSLKAEGPWVSTVSGLGYDYQSRKHPKAIEVVPKTRKAKRK